MVGFTPLLLAQTPVQITVMFIPFIHPGVLGTVLGALALRELFGVHQLTVPPPRWICGEDQT